MDPVQTQPPLLRGTLPPLSDTDGALLSLFLRHKENHATTAAEANLPILSFLLWLSRPDITAYLTFIRQLEDSRRRMFSLDSLAAALDSTKDPVEIRRIATAILRATSPRTPPPKITPPAIHHLPAPQSAPPPTAAQSPQAASLQESHSPVAPARPSTPAPNPKASPSRPTPPPYSAIAAPQSELPSSHSPSPPHLPTSSPPQGSLHAALAHYNLPTDLADLDPDLAAGIIADLSGETDRLEDEALDAECDELDDVEDDADST